MLASTQSRPSGTEATAPRRRFRCAAWTAASGASTGDGGCLRAAQEAGGRRHAQTTLIDVTDMRRTEEARCARANSVSGSCLNSRPWASPSTTTAPRSPGSERLRSLPGVTDLDAWFDAHPTGAFRRHVPGPAGRGANAAMLRLTGAATLPELVALEARLFTPDVTRRPSDLLPSRTGRGATTARESDDAGPWTGPRAASISAGGSRKLEGKPYHERGPDRRPRPYGGQGGRSASWRRSANA